VANFKDDVPIDQLIFWSHEGRNISVGGISYFTSSQPECAQVVIGLPAGEKYRYVLAHIRNVCRVADARYFTCCQFVRELAYHAEPAAAASPSSVD
jgi:hypothetical protein